MISKKIDLKKTSTIAIITILTLSILLAAIPMVSAEHTSTATVAFSTGESTVAGAPSTLDVEVANDAGSIDNIVVVKIDFTGTGFTNIGAGELPDGWTGTVVGSVVTYTSETGINPGDSVTFVPTVTNPKVIGVTPDAPTVLTSDDGPSKAILTTGTEGVNQITYEAVTAGSAGNNITIQYVDDELNSGLSVNVTDSAILVELADAGEGPTSTTDDVAAAINADADASALVTATVVDEGGIVAVEGPTNLVGGSDILEDSEAAVTNNLGAITAGIYPDSGPVETEVVVTGDALTPGGKIEVYWDAVRPWDPETKVGFLTSTYASSLAPYTYVVEITVPEAVYGDHGIVVKDVEANEIFTPYTFTVAAEIVLEPEVGIVGDTITVSGTGFGEEEVIVISYTGPASGTLDTTPTDVTTGALGSFEASFEIPEEMVDGEYTITATGATTLASDDATLTVGTYILLTPDRDLAGATVSISGRGFTQDSTVDVYFGDLYGAWRLKVLSDVPTDADGSFSAVFTVPSITVAEPTEYRVTAIDEEGVDANTTFTITPPASIMLEANSGYAGDEVGIFGEFFTPDSEITVYLDDIVLDTVPTTITTDENGAFGDATTWPVWFIVPEVAAGEYTVKAVDEEGVYDTAKFTVMVPVIVIETRATEYLQGDTISIYANSSEPLADVVLEITDPDGMGLWSKTLESEEVTQIDVWYVLASYITAPLPSDAPLGSWNFTAYADAERTEILDTNLFTVVEKPSIQMVLDRIDELDATLSGLITDAEGSIKAYIDTSLGPVTASLDEINAKLVSIENGIATINSTVGEIKVSVDALDLSAIDAKLTSIKDGVATVSTAIGDVQTSLGEIVESIESVGNGVVEIKTKVDTIEGKVVSIDNDVAVIRTDVGDVKADVSTIKGNTETIPDAISAVTIPIWIAVVLSLIAALAAIASVVTITRKIAG